MMISSIYSSSRWIAVLDRIYWLEIISICGIKLMYLHCSSRINIFLILLVNNRNTFKRLRNWKVVVLFLRRLKKWRVHWMSS